MHAHYRTNLSYRMSICARIIYILYERFKYVIGRDNDPCRPWIYLSGSCQALCIYSTTKRSQRGETHWTLTSCESHSTMQGYSSHLCMKPKETRQNNSKKYMGHQKECLLPVPTTFLHFSQCCLYLTTPFLSKLAGFLHACKEEAISLFLF